MKRSLLEKLRCPISQNSLHVFDLETQMAGEGKNVSEGMLCDDGGDFLYPIINGIPILLIFKTPLTEKFVANYRTRIEDIKGLHPQFQNCQLPDLEPEKGEQAVQKTFTEEWDSLDDTTFTFRYSKEQTIVLQRQVWLRDLNDEEVSSIGDVLDIGCGGFADESLALSKLNSHINVYGIDLSLSLVKNGHLIDTYDRVHCVVCSLFHLPFSTQDPFDLVFSQGVLHHTFSTYAAIQTVRKYVAEKGFMFIWLYAVEDPLRGQGLRKLRSFVSYLILMRSLRPILSRTPVMVRQFFVHLIAIYTHLRIRQTKSRPTNWRYKNTVHGVYDSVTPRYAHDHSFNETIEFVEGLGFSVSLASPTAYRSHMGWPIHGIGILAKQNR